MKPQTRLIQGLLLTALISSISAATLPNRNAFAGQDTRPQRQVAIESLQLEVQELKKSIITHEQMTKALRERDDILLQQLSKSVEAPSKKRRKNFYFRRRTH